MEVAGLLILGCLIGMTHALEADHLAAIATLSARRSTRRQLILRGAYWGLGHTISLFAVCGAAILAGLVITAPIEAALELCVGIMIVGLGTHLLATFRRRRIHFHVHDHGGARHIHAHSHRDEPVPHAQSAHDHEHADSGSVRALAIGMVHGTAGSGALLVLAAAAAQSASTALLYIAAFGLGSIIGMAALSCAVSFPLTLLQHGAQRVRTGTVVAIGCAALGVGGSLIADSARTLGLLAGVV